MGVPYGDSDEAHAQNHVRINYKFMSNELFFITSCDFSILHGTQVKYVFYLSIACMLSIFPSWSVCVCVRVPMAFRFLRVKSFQSSLHAILAENIHAWNEPVRKLPDT